MPTPEELTVLFKQFQDTLASWPRESGLFFDLLKKKIEVMQNQFAQEVATQLPSGILKKVSEVNQAPSNVTDVYVELYQTGDDNIDRWAMILKAIAVQAISRPVYQNEADVCSFIRTKQQKNREGYAVVSVPNGNILGTAMQQKDSAGRPLLQIKPGTLKSENISRFVHISGQYAWQKDKLIKLDLPSPIATSTDPYGSIDL